MSITAAFRWDDLFPIADEPSARLMKIKAACLKQAGVISAWQKSEIERRADQVIAQSVTPGASRRSRRGRKRREPAEQHAA